MENSYIQISRDRMGDLGFGEGFHVRIKVTNGSEVRALS